jgi:hypothetical protein
MEPKPTYTLEPEDLGAASASAPCDLSKLDPIESCLCAPPTLWHRGDQVTVLDLSAHNGEPAAVCDMYSNGQVLLRLESTVRLHLCDANQLERRPGAWCHYDQLDDQQRRCVEATYLPLRDPRGYLYQIGHDNRLLCRRWANAVCPQCGEPFTVAAGHANTVCPSCTLPPPPEASNA